MYRLSDLITQVGEVIVMGLPSGGVTDSCLPLEQNLNLAVLGPVVSDKSYLRSSLSALNNNLRTFQL